MMGKGKASFRMIERVGACVGVCSPYDMPWRAPFTVTAVKQAQLFHVSSSAMVSVLSHFLDHDEQVVLKNMEKEYAQCVGQQGVDDEKKRRSTMMYPGGRGSVAPRAQGRQVAVVEAVVEGGGGRGGGPRVHAQAGARPRRQGRLHRLEHVVGRRGVDGDVARVGLCVGW